MYTMHAKRPYTPVKDPIVHVLVQWIYRMYGKARITLCALSHKCVRLRVFKLMKLDMCIHCSEEEQEGSQSGITNSFIEHPEHSSVGSL